MTDGGNNETDRRLHLTVGLVVVVGLGILGWATATILNRPADTARLGWTIAAMTLIIMFAARLVIVVRFRSERHGLSTTNAAILVGMMLLHWSWLVLCVALGVAGAMVWLRLPPIKAIWNIAKDTVGAAVAVLVTGAFGLWGPYSSGFHHFGLVVVGPIVVGAIVLAALDDVLGNVIIAMATRTSVRSRLAANWDIRLGSVVARLILAVAAMYLIAQQPALVLGIPPLILGVYPLAASRLRQRSDRETWTQLAKSTDEFNTVDLEAVLAAAVGRAATLLSADDVEVEVHLPDRPARLVRGDAAGISYDGDPAGAPPVAGTLLASALASHDGKVVIGQVRLRFRHQVELSEREQYVLRTFAAALCTAIRNAVAFAETRQLSESHAHAAAHDVLTGLYNRRYLFEAGAAVLTRPGDPGVVGMLLIDLNQFKQINDALGHTSGDRVLREVALRLQANAHPDDLVVRLGGDEFAVVFTGLAAPALAVPRARALLSGLASPMNIDGMHIVVSASAGVALAPNHGGMQELLRRADVAMYCAKREGQNVALYTEELDTADLERLTLQADLPRAVRERQFSLEFQPVVDLGTGEVVSAEALARWHHPRQGSVSPALFIGAVERSGLLPAFSAAVLEEALHAAATLRMAGHPLPIAVNVSPRSLLDPTFPDQVERALEAANVPPEALIVELTETLTLSQLDVVEDVLGALENLGVRIALDDFGTGYSSLTTVARVPVHELKIDRAFITDMTNPTQAAVVRSTIDLGRNLGLMVVAEGVESEEQRRLLWEMGCPAGQGHLFARSMPLPKLLDTLTRGYAGRPGALAPVLRDSGTVIRLPKRSTPTTPDSPPRRGSSDSPHHQGESETQRHQGEPDPPQRRDVTDPPQRRDETG